MRVLALLLFFLCVAVPVRAAGLRAGRLAHGDPGRGCAGRPGRCPLRAGRAYFGKNPLPQNRYLFGDGSGRVVVEIENDIFGHLTITPHDRVRLMGHVNWSRKRSNEVEVEVDALALID